VDNPLDPDDPNETREIYDDGGEVIGIQEFSRRTLREDFEHDGEGALGPAWTTEGGSLELRQFPDAAGVLERVEERPPAPVIPLTPEDRKTVVDEVRGAVFDATSTAVKLPNPFEGLELPAEDLVNHPKHYNNHPSGVQCIEIVRHMSFAPGNAFKYIFRCFDKNGRQDLEKAVWYLNDTLNHPNPILLPSWGLEQYHLLDLVCLHEPHPHRVAAYRHLVAGAPRHTLKAVELMLADS
jgi:hypothetical protein